MINSRWLRLIGIIVFIVMMLVWIGWLTDLRLIMFGAIFSTGYATSLLMGFLLSIGWLRALMTCLSIFFSMGIWRSLLVVLTSEFSSIFVYLLRIIAPTSVFSRFKVRLVMLFPKSSISFSI